MGLNQDSLTRSGVVVESRAGTCRVWLDDASCSGCDGRCGVGFRSPRRIVEVEGNAPVGARVEVRAACASFARASAVLFGLPLATLAAALVVVAVTGASEVWIVGGLLTGLALAAGLSRRGAAQSPAMLRRL